VQVNAYKIVTSSRGFILHSDWYHQIQAPEVDSFPANVTRLSFPPIFEERGQDRG